MLPATQGAVGEPVELQAKPALGNGVQTSTAIWLEEPFDAVGASSEVEVNAATHNLIVTD